MLGIITAPVLLKILVSDPAVLADQSEGNLPRLQQLWSSNATTRAIATPKLLLVDSGLGAHLAGLTPSRVADITAPAGPLIENFALGELARQLTWSEEPVRLYHYRDRDGVEVDGILERASGEIIGIEVKATETVRANDFRGLQHLARKLGDRLIAGYVLYAGQETLPFGNRMRALPLSTLWTASSTTCWTGSCVPERGPSRHGSPGRSSFAGGQTDGAGHAGSRRYRSTRWALCTSTAGGSALLQVIDVLLSWPSTGTQPTCRRPRGGQAWTSNGGRRAPRGRSLFRWHAARHDQCRDRGEGTRRNVPPP
ncbi:DUF4143 domain-containing protein [Nonomuraea sp. NPDC001699]